MTRNEHLAWCKERALAELPDCTNAVASMISDLIKHPAFENTMTMTMASVGFMEIPRGVDAVRKWVEGFN